MEASQHLKEHASQNTQAPLLYPALLSLKLFGAVEPLLWLLSLFLAMTFIPCSMQAYMRTRVPCSMHTKRFDMHRPQGVIFSRIRLESDLPRRFHCKGRRCPAGMMKLSYCARFLQLRGARIGQWFCVVHVLCQLMLVLCSSRKGEAKFLCAWLFHDVSICGK